MAEETAAAEWRAHWPLVAAATVGMSITSIHFYSLGVMIEPLHRAFGWSRTEITFGETISAFSSTLLAPVCGWMMDRWGPRRIALPGLALFALGFGLFATVNGSLVHFYLMWLALCFGLLGLKPNVWCGAVASRFVTSRALAFAVTIAGTSVGAAIVPSIAHMLVAHYGWRGGYIGLALIWAAATLPLCYMFFRTPLDGASAPAGAGVSVAADRPGLTVAQGLRSPAFYRLLIAGTLFSFAMIGITLMFVPILEDHGLRGASAAGIAGAIGVAAIVGQLLSGVLLDRFPGAAIGGLTLMLPTAPILILLFAPIGVPLALLAATLLGLALGGELNVIAYLSTRHFGLRCYGTLFGIVISGLAAGTAFGPLATAAMRDHTGSYALMLWVSIPMFLISAIAIATIGRYPCFAVNNAIAPLPLTEGS